MVAALHHLYHSPDGVGSNEHPAERTVSDAVGSDCLKGAVCDEDASDTCLEPSQLGVATRRMEAGI
jgi:hypothetical protein